jgi:hypothetical protein
MQFLISPLFSSLSTAAVAVPLLLAAEAVAVPLLLAAAAVAVAAVVMEVPHLTAVAAHS